MTRLYDRVNGPNTQWLPVFLEFAKRVRVTSKDFVGEPQPIELYRSQEMLLEHICDALDADIHTVKELKARQLGCTTLLELLDIFWLDIHPGTQGAFILDSGENKDNARSIISEMLDNVDPDFQVPYKTNNRSALLLENGSRLQYMAAGKRKNSGLGRSRALNFLHACLDPETPVLVEHGRVKAIKDIQVGDLVITHTGAAAPVSAVWPTSNESGDVIEITPWLGKKVICTSNHKIPTQRGLVEAADLRLSDQLLMPVRPITHLDSYSYLPPKRYGNNGSGPTPVGADFPVELNEEFGFFCGYYLAEGCLIRNAEVVLTRHRSEGSYADRAIKAVSRVITSNRRTMDVAHCLTTTHHLYGAPLVRWLDEHFGRTDSKRIPDYVFTWGEDFCRGLVTGLLCGDGSKSCTPTKNRKGEYAYPTNTVFLTSTRSSIAHQLRDLVASLGFGWACIDNRKAGIFYGRNCKETWTVRWSGEAAANLRGIMGLPVFPRRGNKSKYEIRDGFVRIQIRQLESVKNRSHEVWDLTVDHADHTFRTPHMSVGNSELCEWGDRDGLDVLLAALSTENPNRLYVYESTAKGFGLWYELFEEGKDDPTQRCHFIGWWAKYTRDAYGNFKSGYFFSRDSEEFARFWGQHPRHTQYEERITEEVAQRYGEHIEPEQWAYYRWLATQRGGSSLRAEYPSVEEEAWQETGNPFFPATQIGADEQFITSHDVTFNGYRCELGVHFADLKVIPCDGLKDVELRVWEEPRAGARYVIGCDPAYGSSETADRSVISVWRAFADKLVQVAEYATEKPSAQQCAWVLAYLGACYRDCRINLEINGPGGSIMEEMKHLKLSVRIGELSTRMAQIGKTTSLDGITWFLYHRVDSLGAGFAYNWKTTMSTKSEMMNSMFINYSSNQLIIRSIPLLHEMRTMIQDGDSIGGRSGTKDDRVIGAALANIAWLKWERPGLMGQNRTYERDMAVERQRHDAQIGNVTDSILDSIVPNYFKQMEAQVTAAKMRKLLEG